jgi:hypothetical protein
LQAAVRAIDYRPGNWRAGTCRVNDIALLGQSIGNGLNSSLDER